MSVPSSASASDELPRRLGFWSATAIIIGIVIGSGIFRTPASIAQSVDSVWLIGALWVAGGVATLCLGLCLAELATMFPRAGGMYVYLREAFGPAVAFVYGWTFLIVNPSVWAALALIFGEYLGRFLELDATGRRLAATLLIAFVATTNYFSTRLAVGIQNIATSAKAFALAAIAGAVFLFGDGAAGALTQASVTDWPAPAALLAAFLAVLFSYEGIAAGCAAFGEVRDPAKTLPRALLTSVVTVTLLYVLVNAAYFYVLPLATIASSELVAAEAIQHVIGDSAGGVIAACVMLSTFGAISATAVVDPRVFYAMAKDGMFFERIGTAHPRYQTPHVSIVISGVLAAVYVWLRTFEELAAHFVLGFWPFYALIAAGVIRLRMRAPALCRPFRVPLYPLPPLVFLGAAGTLLVVSLVELPRTSAINLAITLAGVPVYWLWTSRLARVAQAQPGGPPSSP